MNWRIIICTVIDILETAVGWWGRSCPSIWFRPGESYEITNQCFICMQSLNTDGSWVDYTYMNKYMGYYCDNETGGMVVV